MDTIARVGCAQRHLIKVFVYRWEKEPKQTPITKSLKYSCYKRSFLLVPQSHSCPPKFLSILSIHFNRSTHSFHTNQFIPKHSFHCLTIIHSFRVAIQSHRAFIYYFIHSFTNTNYLSNFFFLYSQSVKINYKTQGKQFLFSITRKKYFRQG